ncbi:cyclin-like protein [Cantharellus anzutake]|uniref:cyclin-like protein n=1 Tax=Cantharellus anzutake TaxID=1750568 RepID=UPI001904C626|nr:cyclin-like protein [Cantharellus anzutake]KAF8337594.1 cyclin-like protein [Cantharellus anzutake]
MATDFWRSSHYKYWLVDQTILKQARSDDLKYATQREISLINILFANVISKLGKRLEFRQQVIATAIVYFRRFYLKNSYCETDPFVVAAACCYVAAKVEESPAHLKSVVTEARNAFGNDYGIKSFPTDHTKLGEMEFYLLEDLDFQLTVYHPYQDLADLCGNTGHIELKEEGEEGYVPEEERFWGTGEGKLVLEEGAIQTSWFIISDSFRTELCLLYPPYLIAIAALYMTCVLHTSISSRLLGPQQSHARNEPTSQSMPPSPTSSTKEPGEETEYTSQFLPHASSSSVSPRDEILNFLARLNVSIELIGYISQQILSTYSLWDSFTDRSEQDAVRRADRAESNKIAASSRGWGDVGAEERVNLVTEREVVAIVLRMRQDREIDVRNSADTIPVGANRMLEGMPRVVGRYAL